MKRCRAPVACLASLLLATLFAPAARTLAADDTDLPALLKSQPVKADPKDGDVRKLMVERYNAAVQEVRDRYRRVQGGTDTPHQSCEALKRLAQAGLELNERAAGRATLLEACVEVAKGLEKMVEERVNAGVKTFTPADLSEATYFRADLEIQWLRAKEKLKGEKK